jgi:hypothetical protein
MATDTAEPNLLGLNTPVERPKRLGSTFRAD